MHKNIVIIGQGEIGKAIMFLLSVCEKDLSLECWDVDVHLCPDRKPLARIIPNADVLFLCIPSWAMRSAARKIRSYLRRRTIIVLISKGLDRSSGKTVDELIDELFSILQPTVLLSGPMLAEEIMEGKAAAAVAASVRRRSRETVTDLFRGTALRLTPIADVRGAALCGILKNIYAIGFGAAQAMHPGDNFRGLYVQRTLEEMERVVVKLKGKRKTVRSLAGVGDLVATGFSKHSKNHEYGKDLALKGEAHFDCEGSVSLDVMKKMIGPYAKTLPLFMTICSVVHHKRPAENILEIS
jgi:glycerol-3-phosphate dehydrogenase (NAD(P)+)